MALDGERDADRAAEQAMGAGPARRAQNTKQRPGSGGRPLDASTRAFFEGRFGAHFGDVRVHAGGAAGEAARAVGARAVTVGNDIAFDAGEYRPGSEDGKALLAHELAHTLQPGPPVARPRLKVNPGVELDTKGFSVTRAGDVYTGTRTTQSSLRNEIFSGLLASPRTFEVFGATSAEADENVHRQVTARRGVVAFAAKKRYGFGSGADFRMNPRFWDVGRRGLRERPGVSRAAAIDDLNVHPKQYAIACRAATELTLEGGGRSPFDGKDLGAREDDWVPGEAGYIYNAARTKSTSVGLEGENIIATGRGRFWGHFGPELEYRTLGEWVDTVKHFSDPPGNAEVTGIRRWPTVGIADVTL
jgi:hypothetical protein